MDRIQARLAVIGVVVLGATALALAQGRAQFGYLDVRTPAGDQVRLHATPETDSQPEVQFLGRNNLAVELQLPSRLETGSPALIAATLHHGSDVEEGLITLDVQEAGRFVSGTLHGTVAGLELSGGLRVLHPAVAAVAVSSASPR